MGLLANYSLETRDKFWKFYPQYKTVGKYKELYNSDKSKGKKLSSLIMWCACLLYERSNENPYRKLSIEEKKQLLEDDVLENNSFDWEKYKDIFEFFANTNISTIEKAIIDLEDKIRERTEFLMGLEYSLDHYEVDKNGDNILSKTGNPILVKGTAIQLDSMLAQSDKLFNLVSTLQDQRLKELESEAGETKGGREESWLERQVS